MSLNLAKPKRELKAKIKVIAIIEDLKVEFNVKELTSLEVQQMKGNPSLINYICNIVEVKIKKKYGCDKKDVVLEIVTKLFLNHGLTDQERVVINGLIQYFHSNGNIIANTTVRYVKKYLWEILKKKVAL